MPSLKLGNPRKGSLFFSLEPPLAFRKVLRPHNRTPGNSPPPASRAVRWCKSPVTPPLVGFSVSLQRTPLFPARSPFVAKNASMLKPDLQVPEISFSDTSCFDVQAGRPPRVTKVSFFFSQLFLRRFPPPSSWKFVPFPATTAFCKPLPSPKNKATFFSIFHSFFFGSFFLLNRPPALSLSQTLFAPTEATAASPYGNFFSSSPIGSRKKGWTFSLVLFFDFVAFFFFSPQQDSPPPQAKEPLLDRFSDIIPFSPRRLSPRRVHYYPPPGTNFSEPTCQPFLATHSPIFFFFCHFPPFTGVPFGTCPGTRSFDFFFSVFFGPLLE